jgi:hypothetical protein
MLRIKYTLFRALSLAGLIVGLVMAAGAGNKWS